MPADRVETLRRIYESWGRGDFRTGVDLLDEQVVFMNTPDFIPQRIAWGLAETRRFMADFLDDWEDFRIEATELREAGDSVIAAVRQHGVGRDSHAPVDVPYFQVWTFRGDRVIRLENFWEETDALRALGLPAND
jgi:ketosteroid isomerase-like protein